MSVDRILLTLFEAGISAGLKTEPEEGGLTGWVRDFAHDRSESVTWLGVENEGRLHWPTSQEMATWFVETAVRQQRAAAFTSEDADLVERRLRERLDH